MKGRIRRILVACLVAVTLTSCGRDASGLLGPRRGKTQVRVLFAGSLIVPFDDLEVAFEAQFPNVDVLMEGHGSIQCIRHVTELGELADVVAVADHTLIPLLMYETQDAETGKPYATWTMQFATNELGLAYTAGSAYADNIGPDNWYAVLSRPGVMYGLSDPRFDACGYRGLMATQLATDHYGEQDLFYNLFGNQFTRAVRVQESGDGEGRYTILVPQVLHPEEGSGLTMRGASVQLLGLLESGDLDYAFEYRSVSSQHDLGFLALPPEINLSDAGHADAYRRARVRLAFRRFATVNPEFEGRPIAYGLTIPSNAPHRELAVQLVQFLMGPEGQRVMAQNEHPMLVPPVVDNEAALPAALRP